MLFHLTCVHWCFRQRFFIRESWSLLAFVKLLLRLAPLSLVFKIWKNHWPSSSMSLHLFTWLIQTQSSLKSLHTWRLRLQKSFRFHFTLLTILKLTPSCPTHTVYFSFQNRIYLLQLLNRFRLSQFLMCIMLQFILIKILSSIRNLG